MLSEMYVVWWVVREGRPRSTRRQHRHHNAAAASAAGVKSGEARGVERKSAKRDKKSHKHLVSTLVMLLFLSLLFGGDGGHSEVWRDGHF